MADKKKSSDTNKPGDRYKEKSHKEARLWDLVSKTAKPLAGRDDLYNQHLQEFLSDHEGGCAPEKPQKSIQMHRRQNPPNKPNGAQKTTQPPSPSSLPIKWNEKLNISTMLEHGDSPGVDKRTAQRFKRGKMKIDAKVDLHGHSLKQAHIRLRDFIQSSHAAGHRCVLVVTGKGERNRGAIKQSVPGWLNDLPLRDKILSFSFARVEDGGEGALYILLKRQRG